MNTRLMCVLAVALAAAISLSAQSSSFMVVNIPFGFQAGRVMLPAGKYEVNLKLVPGFVWLATEDRKASAIVGSYNKETLALNENGKLVFNRYGNHYFLSQVWPYGTTGREIPMSAREKEIARSVSTAKQETLLARVPK